MIPSIMATPKAFVIEYSLVWCRNTRKSETTDASDSLGKYLEVLRGS